MNKISFIIEFDEVSKTQEEQFREFIENTRIKFQVLESDNDLKKYKKYKDNWNKLKEFINLGYYDSYMYSSTIINKMQELEKSDKCE